jgi:hypothetical protein
MMAIDTYSLVNQTQQMGNLINDLETRLLKIENEMTAMHTYLDRMGIDRAGGWGRDYTISERMDILATRGEVKFERS